MGCLFRMFAGVMLIALGAAIALLLPPFMEQQTSEQLAVKTLSKKTLAKAKVGDQLLVSGKVSKKNKSYEHGLVLGVREKWAVDEHYDPSSDTTDEKWTWVKDKEYRAPLKVFAGGQTVTVEVDSPYVSGDRFEKTKSEEMRWSGLVKGSAVTIPAKMTAKKPPSFVASPGEGAFAGTEAQWRKSKKDTAEVFTWIFYAMGGVFGLAGVVTFLMAPFKRKD